MNLVLTWITRLRGDHLLFDTAYEIAEQCRDYVRRRSWDRAITMPTAQARGYVRARARQVVEHAVNRTLSRRRPSLAKQRSRLVQLAIRNVVDDVLSELTYARSRPMPLHRAA